MKILEWNWINYTSYGNVRQSIKLNPDKGELILLQAKSGEGKSSAICALDLALFGEVQNKQGKRLPQKNIPNRINGHLDVNVIFETDQECAINRSMENSSASIKTTLLIDKIPYGKATKIDDKILEKLGFDYKTYKSFISMNVNNFKNFISLTPEEKRILLDKLFNLEVINDLNKILKQLQKNNELSFNTINGEIRIYRENITELEKTIKSVVEKNKDNKELQLAELKELLNSKKDAFEKLDAKRNELVTLISDIQDGLSELTLKVQDINRDILDINVKIALFKSGKCPTCSTLLIGELNLLPEFTERLAKTTEVRDKLNKKITKGQNGVRETKAEYNLVNGEYDTLMEFLTEIKAQMKVLRDVEVADVTEFEKNVKSSKIKLVDKEESYLEVQKLKFVYDMLMPIWSESGIKRDIIDSIVGPLNEYISEDLVHLKTRFRVELDNNFDAHIYEWNIEIDPDTLSTGEAKKINMVIMLAYIKMLRMKKDINILFLDEVFASLDVESVDQMLMLFKKFANDRNINIFLVHHSELKEYFFDRILTVKKGTFSYIEEKIINQD